MQERKYWRANFPGRDDLSPIIHGIRSATERGAQLTGRLARFARPGGSTAEVVDAAEVVRDMNDLLRQAVGRRNTVDVAVVSNGSVSVDRSEFEAALLNLCINARDAMDDGGAIKITTAVVRYQGSDWMQVSVSDHGAVMSRGVRDHALEPFFTTKEGRGTGLGLAMVARFVANHNGDVSIESDEGVGTTVALHLPLATV